MAGIRTCDRESQVQRPNHYTTEPPTLNITNKHNRIVLTSVSFIHLKLPLFGVVFGYATLPGHLRNNLFSKPTIQQAPVSVITQSRSLQIQSRIVIT